MNAPRKRQMSAPRAPAARCSARSRRAMSQAVVDLPMKEGRPTISSGIARAHERVLDDVAAVHVAVGEAERAHHRVHAGRAAGGRAADRLEQLVRRAVVRVDEHLPQQPREPSCRARECRAGFAHQLDRDRELQRRGGREAGAGVPGCSGAGSQILDEEPADAREPPRDAAHGSFERRVLVARAAAGSARRKAPPRAAGRRPARRRSTRGARRRRSPSRGSSRLGWAAGRRPRIGGDDGLRRGEPPVDAHEDPASVPGATRPSIAPERHLSGSRRDDRRRRERHGAISAARSPGGRRARRAPRWSRPRRASIAGRPRRSPALATAKASPVSQTSVISQKTRPSPSSTENACACGANCGSRLGKKAAIFGSPRSPRRPCLSAVGRLNGRRANSNRCLERPRSALTIAWTPKPNEVGRADGVDRRGRRAAKAASSAAMSAPPPASRPPARFLCWPW